MKRSITQIILTVLIVMAASAFAEERYNGGDGTEANPYQINTAEQLQQIGDNPEDWAKHFILVADIDLSDYDGEDGRPAFNIIGTDYLVPFTGKFDGNGKVISNFTLASEYGEMYRLCSVTWMKVVKYVICNLKMSSPI